MGNFIKMPVIIAPNNIKYLEIRFFNLKKKIQRACMGEIIKS